MAVSILRQIINKNNEAGSIFSKTKTNIVREIRSSKWCKIPYYGFDIPNEMNWKEEKKIISTNLSLWSNFFQKHGGPQRIIRNPNKNKTLKNNGIPPQMRAKVWMNITGAHTKFSQNKGYYDSILKTHDNFRNKSMRIIEKDLLRSFPEHPYFQKNCEGYFRLKRVLLAYSWRNPLVSYCQAFNYIVGIFLLHFAEEEAFWMFVHLIEEILPANYYNPELKGMRIDGKVLEMLLKVYCPKLHSFFQKHIQIDVCSVFICSWFLSLFINAFPMFTAMRIWDCIFLEGSKILFRIAIGFFKINEKKILKLDRVGIIKFFQSSTVFLYDYHVLLKTGFGLRYLSKKHINSLREKCKKIIEKEQNVLNERRKMKQKQRIDKFTKEKGTSETAKGLFEQKTTFISIKNPSSPLQETKKMNKEVEKDEEERKLTFKKQKNNLYDPLMNKLLVKDEEEYISDEMIDNIQLNLGYCNSFLKLEFKNIKQTLGMEKIDINKVEESVNNKNEK